MTEDCGSELVRTWAPTLLTQGARHSICSLADQQLMRKQIRRARRMIYPQAGHAVHREEPQRFAQDLASFAADLAGQPARAFT